MSDIRIKYEKTLEKILVDVCEKRLHLIKHLKKKNILHLFSHIARCKELLISTLAKKIAVSNEIILNVMTKEDKPLEDLFEAVKYNLKEKGVVPCSTQGIIPKDLKGHVLQFLLLAHFDCFISNSKRVKQPRLETQVRMDIGGAMQDAMNLAIICKGFDSRHMTIDPTVHHEIVSYEHITDKTEKMKQYLTYCAVVFAMEQMPIESSKLLDHLMSC